MRFFFVFGKWKKLTSVFSESKPLFEFLGSKIYK